MYYLHGVKQWTDLKYDDALYEYQESWFKSMFNETNNKSIKFLDKYHKCDNTYEQIYNYQIDQIPDECEDDLQTDIANRIHDMIYKSLQQPKYKRAINYGNYVT